MTLKKVVIAGAGIGGLTLALALLRRGINVEVYEQATELKELGAGVQIAPNGSRLLLDLGLGQALASIVCEASAKEVRLWSSGQTWKLFDLGQDSLERFGAPYWMVHRGELHRVLREAVQAIKPDAIHVGAKALGFTQDDNGIVLELAGGGTVEGCLLIGADGVHSAIRNQMFQSPKPHFTGILAWRGLARISDLPADLQRPVGTNWIGPGGHVITYPIKSGTYLNFVGLSENDSWTGESWTERGTIAECKADFANWHPLIHQIIDNLDQPYRWALIAREPLSRWTIGRVTLLGDACHPTLPFLAQGALMAIEDAVVLANCLSSQAPVSALANYENLRIERTSLVVKRSSANTGRFHNPALGDARSAVDYVEREWEPSQVRQRYDWLFEYDARKIGLSQVA